MKSAALMALLLVTALASGQWSVPELVGPLEPHGVHGPVSLCQPGDTLWAFFSSRVRGETCLVSAFRRFGGVWRGPDTAAFANIGAAALGAGVDPAGRIWLAWHAGLYPIAVNGSDPPWDSTGTCMTKREYGYWGPVEPVLPVAKTGAYAARHSFSADAQGRWYLGMGVVDGDTLGLASSTTYSIFNADSWSMPRYIARGRGDICHLNPILVARPDCGVWAVHDSYVSGPRAVCVDTIAGDSVGRIVTFSGQRPLPTADSSGRLWVVFMRDSAVWSVAVRDGAIVDERLVNSDVLPGLGPSAVCTDPMGWIWATWTTRDSTPVVSYSRGGGWAAAEAVTESCAVATGICTESDGRVHVFFNTEHRRYSAYRQQRPSVAEVPAPAVRVAWPRATFLRGVLHIPVSPFTIHTSLFDMTGRAVMSLRPGPNDVRQLPEGVYFVRGFDSAPTRKVVVTR